MSEPDYDSESWDIWHDGRDIYHIDAMTDEVDGEGIKTMIADNVIGRGRAVLMARAPALAHEIDRLKAINADLLAALKAVKIRLAFVGMPQEPTWTLPNGSILPDWRTQIALIEAAQAKAEGGQP